MQMFRKIDKKSLKVKIWSYFVLFAALIMISLWLLQIVLINNFYMSMKISQIKKVGDSIAAEYGKSDFQDFLFMQSYNNGFVAGVYDQSGRPSMDNIIGGMPPPHTDRQSVDILIEKLSRSEDGKTAYIITDPRVNGKILVYGAVLTQIQDEPLYLYVNSQIAPMDTTVTVLQNQLGIVTVISLLLSLALSLIIASRLSRPIAKITESACGLAKGDYNVRFESGDYTEVNQLAFTLNFAMQELLKADELRRELIANISHDLRTPLTMVKMYAELIRDVSGENAKKRNAHTQIIIEEADRLSALTADMLDLSKIQSGTAHMNFSVFDLGEQAGVILRHFHALEERDGYVFRLDREGDTMVSADKRKIEQVIYNLVGNAVNFTGGDKMVMIHVKNADGKVRFEVADTGSGIPEEKLGQIWERYYTADRTKKRVAVGTGLGLSIVKGILEAHNARYGVNSVLGCGSAFWFELAALPPVSKIGEADDNTPA